VLVLGLVALVGVPPVAANDQTCDKLISAPGTNLVGITISAPGTYCLATDVIMAASFTSGAAFARARDRQGPGPHDPPPVLRGRMH